MRVLVAEDDTLSRHLLISYLTNWGYEVIEVEDGYQAWQKLQEPNPPQIAILDWLMPGIDGLEICRRLRQTAGAQPTYIIMLTIKGSKEDILAGFQAGADDYITKPFDRDELQARIQAGTRTIQQHSHLVQRVSQLEENLSQVKKLEDMLPICSYCKRIRTEEDAWEEIDLYITKQLGTTFSHSICPDCYQSHVLPELEDL